MRAVVYDEYGSPEVLHVVDTPTPEPGAGEVLVLVGATSVNSWDWDLVGGDLIGRLQGGLRKPRRRILGIDVAGTVVDRGADASRFEVGREVFGDLSGVGFGAFAEYVAVPERVLAPKPATLSFEQAAAIPHAGVLALQSLRDHRRIAPGDRVLINGAGGGVGSFGIPLARMWGAHVTGVDAERKFDTMRAFGADEVIAYETDDFTKAGKRHDLIVDVTSHRSMLAYRRALRPHGAAVVVGGSIPALLGTATVGTLMSKMGDKRYAILAHKPSPEDLLELSGYIEAGALAPVIDSTWPLDRIGDAMSVLARGAARGKVIVTT
jgi:NADPH:quinone reductase-like Zn-dependent oxidoreductase